MDVDNNPFALKIDIVSDVVCPWCIIGYKRLQQALSMLTYRYEVEMHWHPFELNPHMPPEGENLREHLAQKYGTTPEGSRSARARLTALGQSLGFRFDYYDEMRMVNTFRAHQLLHWAGEGRGQTALKMALFEAFFSRREDVNDVDVLVHVATRAGLPESEAMAVLTDGRYADAVRAEQQQWLGGGVHAVPTFVFNDRYQVSGAQDADTFVRILQEIRANDTAQLNKGIS